LVNLHYENFPDVDYPIGWLMKQVNLSHARREAAQNRI